jgi:hypothetical protein
MNSREAFYLHVHGEQLGPYTLRQIDHQLQTGLISADTLFWSEDMEQWEPVTDLIPLRKKRRPWRLILIVLAALIPLAGLVLFFGPTVVEGWREQTQREYTAEAAYWAARGTVRHELATTSQVPEFLPLNTAHVTLGAENTATVQIEGRIISGKASGQPAAWKVRLHFDPAVRTWSPLPVPASTAAP